MEDIDLDDFDSDEEFAFGEKTPMAKRFRGFLPVVIDVETGGFNDRTDALLEIAAVILKMDDEDIIAPEQVIYHKIIPFKGANLDPASLAFTGIDPDDPRREAVDEDTAMRDVLGQIRRAVRANGCTRAILVAHNAHFDHGFMMAAAHRCGIKRNPFHQFSCLDTVTLAALQYGQTTLIKACSEAGIPFDNRKAHAADYDAKKTADLFCTIINRHRL